MTVTYALTATLLFLGLMLMLVDVNHKLRSSEHKKISLILIGTSMFYVAMDCLWIVVYTAEDFHRGLFVLLNFLFYLVYITLPYIWFLFSKHFAGSRKLRRSWEVLFAVPWFFNLALVILTMPGTGILWEIGDVSSRYTRGPLFGVFSNLNLVYYFIPVIGIIVLLINKRGADRRTLLTTLGFSLIPALGVFIYTYWISVDAIYPFQPCCFFLGVMFAYILLLGHVYKTKDEKLLEEGRQREQQDKMITALSADYWSVYYLELDKDEGVCYRSHGALKGTGFSVGERFRYLESVTAYARQYIPEPYLGEFLRFIQPDAIREGLKDKQVISCTYLVSRDGRETFETVRFAAVRQPGDPNNETVHHVGACFADTDAEIRKTMEQNQILADALTAAEEASKAKTSFLSNMSHEMRTPMNAIIGLNSIALHDPGLSETTRDHLEKIGTSAHHLLGIINDILDMSRIESGRMVIKSEEFSFTQMIAQVNAIISEQCRSKEIAYDCRYIGEVDELYNGDEMKLRQILINILGNAVKFTPEEGRVDFTIEETACFEGRSTLRFVIRDTGVGMSEDYLPKLFEAFSQEDSSTTNRHGSTGLGMPITKSIVELMNGQIDVESEKDKGTTFTVTVTLEKAHETTAGKPAPQTEESVSLNGRRILLAEDVAINAEIIMMILSMREMDVDHALNGKEAVEMFAQHEPGYYDAVLMDMRMPEMDGLEATRTIRAMERDDARSVPIIALTANAFDEDVQRSLQAGLNAHLSKPVEPEVLFRTLEEWMGGQEIKR